MHEKFTIFLYEQYINGIVIKCGFKQEALQMQRDHVMRHKYEMSHLKRFAIGK